MRQSTKILLVMSGILAAFGLCLCIVSACLGMTFGTLRNMFRSGELHIPLSFGGGSMAETSVEMAQQPSEDTGYNKGMFSVPADGLTDLLIDLDVISLDIKESSDGENMSFEMDDSVRDFVFWNYDGGYLEIYEEEGDWNRDKGKATLYLPEGVELMSVDIQTDTGSITSDVAFSCTELRLNADTGKIDMSDVNASWVSLESDTGKIHLEGSVQGYGYASADTGKIEIELTEGREDDYNYSIQSDVGKISIGDKNYSGLSVSDYIDNGSEKEWELYCDVGAVELSFK